MYCSLLATFISLNVACDDFIDCLSGEGEKETRVIELDSIDAFDIFGAFDLTIKQGEEQMVEIFSYPNLIDELLKDSSVENGTWQVGIVKCVSGLKKSNLKITVTMPELTGINITGNADVKTEGTFDNIEELDLKISGSGNADLALGDDIKSITTTVNGNGDFKLSGTTQSHEITINGSGNIDSFDLASEECDIKILGSGNCEVLVNEILEVQIAGSGDLCFKGNPTINSRITGTGNLNDCN